MLKKIIIAVLFFIGLSIFAYPIISNMINNREHHSVITSYNAKVAQLTEAQKQKEKDDAKRYNDEIKASEVPIVDPFADDFDEDDMNQAGYYSVLDIGDTIGSIEIPEIHVDLPIYHGVGKDVLQKGVGHMSNSSFPIGGEGSHTALTAHRGLPTAKMFRNLDKLKAGNIFYVHTLDETLAYKVDDIKIVKPSETSWLSMENDHDYVTLITCDPYMINTDRLLVRGERTPYHPGGAPTKSSTPSQLPIFVYLIVAGLIVTLIFWLVRRRRLQHRI